ncbi:MAG: hypothetical protein AB7S26_00150 [Sandaracinaceae bacterium]
MRRLTAVFVVFLTACTSAEEKYAADLDAAIAPHQAELDALRTGLSAVLTAARARPALSPIATPWSGPPVRWQGNEATALAFNDDRDLDAAYPSGSPGVNGPEHFEPYITQAGVVALAHGQRPAFDEYAADGRVRVVSAELGRLASLRYAVVCHTLAETMPSVSEGNLVPGAYSAECRLFELSGARYLGGFTVDGASADSERVVTGSGASSTVLGQLRGAVAERAAEDAYEALQVTGTASADQLPF